MKLQGYIYPEGFHTEKKPEQSNEWTERFPRLEKLCHESDLAEWHKGLREVVNSTDDSGELLVWFPDGSWDYSRPDATEWMSKEYTPGSPCEYDEKTKSITKIL